MTHRLFEDRHHASIYQQYRFVPPVEIKNMILRYLDEKKEPPHVLAVDLGCGTGQNTRLLALHFQEVVGIDVSENQICEAKAVPGFPNVTYRVGTAEELPFQDGSIDLLTAASAAHWFNQDKFLKEANRTLKPRGCIALLSYTDALKFHYKSVGDSLNSIYEELKKILLPYASPQVAIVNSKLQSMYDAIPFPDKKRIENIPDKLNISVSDVFGFIETFSYYQAYERANPEEGQALLRNTQSRFLKAMAVSSPETKIEMEMGYFCVLACKPQ